MQDTVVNECTNTHIHGLAQTFDIYMYIYNTYKHTNSHTYTYNHKNKVT